MKNLMPFAVVAALVATGATADRPTAPTIPEPPKASSAAVHGVGTPAPALSYYLHQGGLRVNWRWNDDKPWDLVSFQVRLDGETIEGEWNIKPYVAQGEALYPVYGFSWTRPDHGETVPDLCVAVMAKDRSGNGIPTTTYHAENCSPVLQRPMGSSPVTFQPATISAGGYQTCGLGLSGEAHCWGQFYGNAPAPIQNGQIFTELSSGSEHTCALTPAGAAYCWGRSFKGQLGGGYSYMDGTYLRPVPVYGGLAFTQITAGGNHTCALTPAGKAYCWGDNSTGELGIGTSGWANDEVAPVAVGGGLVFTQLTAGRSHTCGRTTEGKAYCWGSNWTGGVGDGTQALRSTPTAVVGDIAFAQLSGGAEHTCGLTANGAAYCWGGSRDRLVPTPVDGGLVFAQISAGLYRTCARTSAGAAYCWEGVNTPAPVAEGLTFVQITGGGHGLLAAHTCGLTTERRAYCWGSNDSGQLGDGTYSSRSIPTAVSARLPTPHLDAGHEHTCAVTPTGTAHCWGQNDNGQLGDGSTSPRFSPAPVQQGPWSPRIIFAQTSAGYDHSCGLTPSGQAYCWGLNDFGQLGNGSTTPTSQVTPAAVAGGHAFSQIYAGYHHTCAITAAGAAFCWGGNDQGQLGDGTTSVRLTPTAVAGGLTFSQITAGAFHTCAVTPSGQAYCWGYNYDGQLGDGTRTQTSSPTLVSGGRLFTQISAGLYHTCGVTGSSAAFCWGWNTYGQLGDGSTITRSSPVAVAGGLALTQITGGGSHTCALTPAGAAYCWGRNNTGQLGNGSQTEQHTPTAVALGLTYTQISAGTDHTCGRIDYPGYWIYPAGFCWGGNGHGQLGDGTTVFFSPMPSAILTLFRG